MTMTQTELVLYKLEQELQNCDANLLIGMKHAVTLLHSDTCDLPSNPDPQTLFELIRDGLDKRPNDWVSAEVLEAVFSTKPEPKKADNWHLFENLTGRAESIVSLAREQLNGMNADEKVQFLSLLIGSFGHEKNEVVFQSADSLTLEGMTQIDHWFSSNSDPALVAGEVHWI